MIFETIAVSAPMSATVGIVAISRKKTPSGPCDLVRMVGEVLKACILRSACHQESVRVFFNR
jgi:hypothetical protein